MSIQNAPFKAAMVPVMDLYKIHRNLSSMGMGELNPGELAERVFGKALESGQLFLYLFRRFGQPVDPIDEYKQAAQYTLTTPEDGIWLRITINGHDSASLPFGYATTESVRDALRTEDVAHVGAWHRAKETWCRENGVEIPDLPPYPRHTKTEEQFWTEYNAAAAARGEHGNTLDTAFKSYCEAIPGIQEALYCTRGQVTDKANAALLTTLYDLKRPTYVRDLYFNAAGRIADADLAYDEDADALYHEGRETVRGASCNTCVAALARKDTLLQDLLNAKPGGVYFQKWEKAIRAELNGGDA